MFSAERQRWAFGDTFTFYKTRNVVLISMNWWDEGDMGMEISFPLLISSGILWVCMKKWYLARMRTIASKKHFKQCKKKDFTAFFYCGYPALFTFTWELNVFRDKLDVPVWFHYNEEINVGKRKTNRSTTTVIINPHSIFRSVGLLSSRTTL